MTEDALELSFDPATIEHLGSNMYSRLPNAVAELIANAYDADATVIEVRIEDSGPSQTITVADNGHGMSRSDLQDKYLRIGRNRRVEKNGSSSESGRRRVSGKKGLGKLALFGIGGVVEVRTKRHESSRAIRITLDWDDLRQGTSIYSPKEETLGGGDWAHGTTVAIRRLERKSEINAPELALSLSRLFNYADRSLSVTVIGRDGSEYSVDAQSRLASIDTEFTWDLPNCAALSDEAVRDLETYGVSGRIVAARKPLPTQVRGITVYSNGRMANEPEFFGASDSSYAYAYLTGYVQVDRLDEIKPDVIATDRRAVNWDLPDSRSIAMALRSSVVAIAQDRRRRREMARRDVTKDKTGVDPIAWQESIRSPKAKNVGELLSILFSEESDLPDTAVDRAINELQEIVPLYADLFWRTLHPTVQLASEEKYKSEKYLEAVVEAQKAFIGLLRTKTSITDGDEGNLIGKSLGSGPNVVLDLLSKFNTHQIWGESRISFENGHRELAKGTAGAFRNPVSHQTFVQLDEIGLYSWQDCLDALSVISYLCRRVEQAEFTGGQGP